MTVPFSNPYYDKQMSLNAPKKFLAHRKYNISIGYYYFKTAVDGVQT